MRVFVGTSGWSYKHWRGVFYPSDLSPSKWLEFYSQKFSTVELNATFYRLPEPSMVENWASRTPQGFVFAVKASRYITHVERLAESGDSVITFLNVASRLGGKLGPVLFQLPPTLRLDEELLARFLRRIPSQLQAAFEFRHPSWRNRKVLRLLANAGAAWVIALWPEEEPAAELTSNWTYLRFHGGSRIDPHYKRSELERWAEFLRNANLERAYAYFNNDARGAAPKDAAVLEKLLAR